MIHISISDFAQTRHTSSALAVGQNPFCTKASDISESFIMKLKKHHSSSLDQTILYTERVLGAVSIRKTILLGMAIPMLKIRRPTGRLIFNMGIPIPGKTVFYIETEPWIYFTCNITKVPILIHKRWDMAFMEPMHHNKPHYSDIT